MAVASLENGISYGEQFEGNNIQNVTAQMSLKIITCGDNCWSSFKKKKKKDTANLCLDLPKRNKTICLTHKTFCIQISLFLL